MKRGYKTFTREEVLKPLVSRRYWNLFEKANKYRNGGVGLKFWMKGWPEDSYIIIKKIHYETPRSGTVWADGYWESEYKGEIEVKDALKLRLWKHEDPNRT